VLYIDHNMGHVMPVADRILLLEHGRIERTLRPEEITEEELKALVARPQTSRS
jgi:ABC-type sugar transport system ATPase subunit